MPVARPGRGCIADGWRSSLFAHPAQKHCAGRNTSRQSKTPRSAWTGSQSRSLRLWHPGRWARSSKPIRQCAAFALITAVTFVVEIGDVRRFDTAPQLMAYLGLVPSESSTGDRVRRGGITKAGNVRARRVLVEGAWTYRFPARVSRDIEARLDGLPRSVREIAWKAQIRLCARYRKLIMAGKTKTVAVYRNRARDGRLSCGRSGARYHLRRKPETVAANRLKGELRVLTSR